MWSNRHEWEKLKKILANDPVIVVYDLETTGLSPANDRIIEIGATKYKVHSNNSFEEIDGFDYLINPGFKLPDNISELTGITDEMLADKPSEGDLFNTLVNFFDGTIVCGYNNEHFDNNFMRELWARYGESFEYDSFDVIKLVKQNPVAKSLENCKLVTVGNYYGIDFEAHRAVNDARATAEVLKILVSDYTDLDNKSDTTKKMPVSVHSVAYWAGYRGFSRIYCETDKGSVYYDIRSNAWNGKDVDIDMLDMESLEKQAFEITDCENIEDFSHFNGKRYR